MGDPMSHPNPEALEVDLTDLGEKLCHWHMGQGDPIYAVGSYAFSGKIHPDRDVVERCLSNIEREQHRDGLTADDEEELADIVAGLNEILSAWPAPAEEA